MPDELNIGPEADSLMAPSTGVSGLVPGSRLGAPDVHPVNSRLWSKTRAHVLYERVGQKTQQILD